jgi:anti-sigma factor RsiW/sugar lactone lactonase YvrE
MQHLGDELLSAYLDGELTPPEALAAAAHLRACAGCAETARLYAAVDERLTAIPTLACASARPLISAHLDGELDGEDATVAVTHLAGCAGCREDVLRWSVADLAIAALPAARPSARVDAAIAALGQEPRGLRLPRVAWPVPAVGVAAALSIAIVISLSLTPARPRADNVTLVAAVQQSVLNPQTGILYVLHPENGTVAALDAVTFAQRMIITVGGRPIALALDAATNTILVLDATAKTVTAIDGTANTVSGSTAVTEIPGVPTSLLVDPSGKLVVTSVVAPAGSAPQGPSIGVVSVYGAGTKKLESVKQVDVAAQLVVIEPSGRRALLVSAEKTTLVDAATYQPLASATGGVSAAFAATGDDFAVLSSSPDGARVSFARRPNSVAIQGAARAIAPLPDGGFAVLTDVQQQGRITVLLADGSVAGTIDLPSVGRDLAYDASSRKFTVIGPSGASNIALPASLAKIPVPVPTAPAAATPLPTAASTPAPSAAPIASPAPPVAVAAPASYPLPPNGARLVWPDTYFAATPGRRTLGAAIEGQRMWSIDDANRVSAFHYSTAQTFDIGRLPKTASVTRVLTSPNHIYLPDFSGTLYVLTMDSEQLATVVLPFLREAVAIAASPDELFWLATSRSGLVSFDPRTGRATVVDAGHGLSAVAVESLGRVWFAAGERQAIDSYDPLTGKLTELVLNHDGAISAMLVDRNGTLWVGTDTGQVFAIRNNSLTSVASAGRRIDSFTLDADGLPWLVSRSAGGIAYGPVSDLRALRTAPATAAEPFFDRLGRAWLADRSADGFYVTVPKDGP